MGVIDISKLPSASFKDIQFLYQDSSVANKGRKTHTHEFPDSRIRSVEDLGADNNIFTITAEIDYSNNFSARNNFITVLEEEGSGLLILPTEEAQEVTVVTYNRDDSRSSLGITSFNITFEKSEINRFPEIVEGSSGLVSNLKDSISDQNETLLSDDWSPPSNSKPEFDFSVSKVVTSIQDKAAGIRKVASNVRSNADGFSEFSSSLNEIVASVNELVQSPSDLADRFKTAFSNLENAYDNTTDLFDSAKQMFNFTAGNENTDGNGTIQKNKAINQDLINDLVSTNALAIGYNAAVNIDFANVDNLNEINTDLEDGFQGLNENLDDDLFQTMLDLRKEANDIFKNLSIGLPKVNILEFINARPLAVLVYQLYGSLDLIDDIEALNDFTDVSCISGDVKVLSDV